MKAKQLAEQYIAKQASLNAKTSASEDKDKNAPPSSKELVNMDSVGGILADYASTNPWAGERAGRTKAMADAIGEPTTFGVKHPWVQSGAYTAGGTLLGSLLGAAAGSGIGKSKLLGTSNTSPTQLGITIGGASGAIAGILQAAANRRKEMKRINHSYDQDAAAGLVDPKHPNFSLLSALLLPFRGAHRTGQLEAVRAMKGGLPIDEQHGLKRDALYAGHYLPGVGLPVGLLHSYGQNIRTQLAGSDPADNQPVRRRQKQASINVASPDFSAPPAPPVSTYAPAAGGPPAPDIRVNAPDMGSPPMPTVNPLNPKTYQDRLIEWLRQASSSVKPKIQMANQEIQARLNQFRQQMNGTGQADPYTAPFKDFAQQMPGLYQSTTQNMLKDPRAGGLAGAAIGGLAGLASGIGADPDDRSFALRGLLGGVAGAGIGAATPYAVSSIKNYLNKQSNISRVNAPDVGSPPAPDMRVNAPDVGSPPEPGKSTAHSEMTKLLQKRLQAMTQGVLGSLEPDINVNAPDAGSPPAPPGYLEKAKNLATNVGKGAIDPKTYLNAGSAAMSNPLYGALLGATAGGTLGAIGGSRRPEEDRSMFTDTVLGSLAGAGIGAGAPLAISSFKKLRQNSKDFNQEAAGKRTEVAKSIQAARASAASPMNLSNIPIVNDPVTTLTDRPVTSLLSGAYGFGVANSAGKRFLGRNNPGYFLSNTSDVQFAKNLAAQYRAIGTDAAKEMALLVETNPQIAKTLQNAGVDELGKTYQQNLKTFNDSQAKNWRKGPNKKTVLDGRKAILTQHRAGTNAYYTNLQDALKNEAARTGATLNGAIAQNLQTLATPHLLEEAARAGRSGFAPSYQFKAPTTWLSRVLANEGSRIPSPTTGSAPVLTRAGRYLSKARGLPALAAMFALEPTLWALKDKIQSPGVSVDPKQVEAIKKLLAKGKA